MLLYLILHKLRTFGAFGTFSAAGVIELATVRVDLLLHANL
jgi:hypothetical protein